MIVPYFQYFLKEVKKISEKNIIYTADRTLNDTLYTL